MRPVGQEFYRKAVHSRLCKIGDLHCRYTVYNVEFEIGDDMG
jgi:hypothetical protein